MEIKPVFPPSSIRELHVSIPQSLDCYPDLPVYVGLHSSALQFCSCSLQVHKILLLEIMEGLESNHTSCTSLGCRSTCD